ncbi:hypothetical protein BDZ89DRAFT_1060588 [Hymenopellis radicata]|nr:hypothetical protein BDZ89DRAFT_1060588 [Hymenopellis radicata]
MLKDDAFLCLLMLTRRFAGVNRIVEFLSLQEVFKENWRKSIPETSHLSMSRTMDNGGYNRELKLKVWRNRANKGCLYPALRWAITIPWDRSGDKHDGDFS